MTFGLILDTIKLLNWAIAENLQIGNTGITDKKNGRSTEYH